MRIRMAFKLYDQSELDMPTLIAAVDEYIEDAWGGVIPTFYTEAVESSSDDLGEVRELFVTISDDVVLDLFKPPTVMGKVE